MKKKVVWLVVSCLMVAALLLASCGPAAVEEEEVVVTPEEEEVVTEEEVVVAEEKEMVRDSLGRLVKKPRYGGTLVTTLSSDIRGFDEPHTSWAQALCTSLHITNEELLTGDFTKGPTGTGEASWVANEFFDHLSVGCLAESWEIPDDQTIIFHIRQGVHWHDKPPVNGRELVADDVVFSAERCMFTPGSYGYSVYQAEVRDALTITAPDKWTVVVKWLPGYVYEAMRIVAEYVTIIPPDMVELHGDMKDWQNSCGTGPFMLVDYVPGSSSTFVRNPDYWRQHPLYPDDTMPYLDGVKWLIIPDASTRLSAMRTGKVDRLGVGWEYAEDLIKTSPQLVMVKNPPALSAAIFMRTDKPELPFHDQRVRQALQLGLDNQAIVNDYYVGNAVLVNHPITPLPELMDMYTPLEELPEVVQELYGYNPEKAKQLLAEAGYPDGFTTEIICTSGGVDLLSIVKAYWEEIGVILNIEVKETAVFTSIGFRRTHKEMILDATIDSTPRTWNNFAPDNQGNKSMIDDPVVNEAIEYWLTHSMEWDNIAQKARETYLYILEQAWTVPLPPGYSFTFWWPWLKDYNGEYSIAFYNWHNYAMYLWIDQDLKKEMGY